MPFVDGLINIVLLLAVLVVLVLIHEFGHFVVARRAGVKVHEFGIGFPPRARVLHQGPETAYTLNWLPIGGFVRLEGEDGDSDDPRSFVRQPLRTRLVILFAGVVMNLLLAWALMSAVAYNEPTMTMIVNELPASTDGSPSPAQQAGLVKGDAILAVDGQTFAWFADPTGKTGTPLVYLREHAGQAVTLTVRHANGAVEQVPVTLRDAAAAVTQGALGVKSPTLAVGDNVQRTILESIRVGLQRTIEACGLILVAVRDLFADIANPQVSGPLGILNAVGIVRELPPVYFVYLIALLSANLAVVNALPLPPMDGGRVAVSSGQGRLGRADQRARRTDDVCRRLRAPDGLPRLHHDLRYRASRRRAVTRALPDGVEVEGLPHLPGRRQTPTVDIGGVLVGSRHPVVVQSMTNTDTADADATALQVAALAHAGSELVRVTVNTDAAAAAVPEMVRKVRDLGIGVPVIGDFHYNGHQLLVEYPAMAQALDKYRINPGNVGAKRHDEHFQTIVEAAIEHGKPVRIGVNWGSLDQALLTELMDANAREADPQDARDVMIEAMLQSALRSAELAEATGLGHDRIVLSAKVSGVQDLVDVYRLLAARCDYPLHLGLTEAGMGMKGMVASAAALSILLQEGIGDTIRVSLTPEPGGDRTEEVRVAQQVLQSLGLRSFLPQVSACPGCGRTTSTFFQEMAQRIQSHLRDEMPGWKARYPGVEEMHVAVMGCVVNGPGESKHADIGISLPGTFEEPVAPVFIDGSLSTTLRGEGLVDEFITILDGYVERRYGSAAPR